MYNKRRPRFASGFLFEGNLDKELEEILDRREASADIVFLSTLLSTQTLPAPARWSGYGRGVKVNPSGQVPSTKININI